MTCRNYPPETKTIKFDLLKQKKGLEQKQSNLRLENYPTGYKWFTQGSGVNFIKKVIQIGEVKLSTQISNVNFFIQKGYPKKMLSKDLRNFSNLTLQRKLRDLFYLTLLMKKAPQIMQCD